MSFIYDVSVPGRAPYHQVICNAIRSSIDIRRELIDAGHPDDIQVRLRKNYVGQAERRARAIQRDAYRFA